ncbi:hypothetical protein FHU30_009023 [Actinomadura rupiterrae]|nr:hypothetical protein [Actinomadura rupiterrae]
MSDELPETDDRAPAEIITGLVTHTLKLADRAAAVPFTR